MDTDKGAKFGGLCERDRNNFIKFNRSLLIFTITFIVAVLVLGPVEGGIKQTPPWHLALIILPLITGIFAVKAFFQSLKKADELIRHVHFEAAAKSFAIVIIPGFIYCLATQIFGEWEDSGAILWAIGYISYVVNVSRTWRGFNV